MVTTTTPRSLSSSGSPSRSSRFLKLITLIGLFLFFLFGAIVIRYMSLGFFRINFGMLRKYIEMRQTLLAFSFIFLCL